mgnify:CR=1 FL=1
MCKQINKVKAYIITETIANKNVHSKGNACIKLEDYKVTSLMAQV